MKGSELAEKYQTLSIPYVKGDTNGRFTNALIQAMGETGQFALVYSGGALRMDAKIVSNRQYQIGYQYDLATTKDVQKTRLVPNEERRELAVQVTLVDTATKKSRLWSPGYKSRSRLRLCHLRCYSSSHNIDGDLSPLFFTRSTRFYRGSSSVSCYAFTQNAGKKK